MIVTCPSCLARFAVISQDLGIDGRRVRCGRCRHDWFQTPAQEAFSAPPPEPAETTLLYETSNLPVVIKASQNSLYPKLAFYCSIIFLLFALTIITSNKLIPFLGAYYNAIGIYDDSNISLSNASAEKIDEGAGKTLMLKGRIVNGSKISKAIPSLRITLLGSDNKRIQVIMLNSNDAPLAPGEGVDFENKISSLPETVGKVVMDIGNVVNLAAR